MNYNKAFILGNLTRDPEIRSTPSGQTVASFGVATNRYWNDQQGQKQSEAEFHNIVAWGKLAEIAKNYLKKGKLVFIDGRIKTRNWEDKAGNKRTATDIIAEGIQLGPDRQNCQNSSQDTADAFPDGNKDWLEEDVNDSGEKYDDLPF